MVLRSQSHNFCKAIKAGFKEANEFARKNVGAATQRYKEYSDARGARIHSRSVTGSEACSLCQEGIDAKAGTTMAWTVFHR